MWLKGFYRLVNLLSVDVAVGSVCAAQFFAKLLQTRIWPFGLLALGLTVWVIYTTDHLMDAHKISNAASTSRHRFHQQYATQIKGVLIAVLMVLCVILFFIRQSILYAGIFLVFGVAIYLLVQHYLKTAKEALISLLYTCGVLLPAVMVTKLAIYQFPWMIIIQFLLTAFINLLVFSWYDFENDVRDGATSFATRMGKKKTALTIYFMYANVCMLTAFSENLIASGIVVLAGTIQVFIFYRSEVYRKQDNYRLLGDAAFMLPILYLFF